MARRSKKTAEAQSRKQLAELIGQARAGKLEWLDKTIREAGYGDPPGEEIVVSSRQLEAGLELSRRQVQEYVTDGMPRWRAARGNRPALYEVWAVVRWCRDHWRRVFSVGEFNEFEATELARREREAEVMKKEAQAKLEHRKMLIEAARLVDRDRVESEMNHLLLSLQAHLEGLPAQIASEAEGRSIHEIAEAARAHLQDAWNAALGELRRVLPPKRALTAEENPVTLADMEEE